MHELHLAKVMNIPLHRINSVIHAYPTFSEIVHRAARMAYIDRVKSSLIVKSVQAIRKKA